MEEALRCFRTYEVLIYIGLGGLALWEIRKFALAWDEVRTAAFGMEREGAQAKLNRAATLLVLIVAMAMAEFILVSFIAPAVPGAIPLPTPTLNLLATPTTTLPASGESTVETAIPTTPTPEVPLGEDCLAGQLNISAPQTGSEVSGKVTLVGTVDFPNLGFYKYEVARPGETIWLTIQAGREVRREETLGEWDTSNLPQGDYLLHLVATDNQGQELGICEIQLRVIAASPPTP